MLFIIIFFFFRFYIFFFCFFFVSTTFIYLKSEHTHTQHAFRVRVNYSQCEKIIIIIKKNYILNGTQTTSAQHRNKKKMDHKTQIAQHDK